MTKGAWFALVAVVVSGASTHNAALAQTRDPQTASPAIGLGEWKPLGKNGAEIMRLVGTGTNPTELTAFRVRYPAGFKTDSQPHYHLGTEHVVILKGTLYLGFGDSLDVSKAKPYGPGSFIAIPAGQSHFEWMQGEVESQVEAIGPMTTIWVRDVKRAGSSK